MPQPCSVCCREAEIQSDRALRKLTQVQLAVTEICGRARNSYSKGVLKKDFKDGLLEMEETAADVEMDAEGNPLPFCFFQPFPTSPSPIMSSKPACHLAIIRCLIWSALHAQLSMSQSQSFSPGDHLHAKSRCHAVEAVACCVQCGWHHASGREDQQCP